MRPRDSIDGQILKTLRRLNRDGQEKAATHFGVHRSAISKWENAENFIARRHLAKLQAYAIQAASTLLQPFGMFLSRVSSRDSGETDETETFHVGLDD
jgi:transcriptional regulator with XRE-family HTH domain